MIGMIGLGNLGRAMAQRLRACGQEVVAWNRSAGKAEGLDVAVVGSPAEVVRRAPVVVVNLRDSAAVRAVLAGPEGLLAGATPRTLVIDTGPEAAPLPGPGAGHPHEAGEQPGAGGLHGRPGRGAGAG